MASKETLPSPGCARYVVCYPPKIDFRTDLRGLKKNKYSFSSQRMVFSDLLEIFVIGVASWRQPVAHSAISTGVPPANPFSAPLVIREWRTAPQTTYHFISRVHWQLWDYSVDYLGGALFYLQSRPSAQQGI